MSQRVTLDNIDMRARLRPPRGAGEFFSYTPRPLARTSRQLFQDIGAAFRQPEPVLAEQPAEPVLAEVMAEEPVVTTPIWAAPAPVARPFASPDSATTVRKTFLIKSYKPEPVVDQVEQQVKHRRTLQVRLPRVKWSRSMMLTAMAIIVFLVGIGVSFAGFRTNNAAKAQITQLNKHAAATTTDSDSTPPSTNQVTVNDVQSYKVAADLARAISIPKLNVYARVLQVGVTNTGALATPTNVFDTAWYKGSAKPGQPGATLIDGHVSSWTTSGVFYGIKNLVAGDDIQVQKGDGSALTYTVVKTVAYDADKVDMNALMKPASGVSGLNLITCGGKYDSKSGEFTQRIAVFATLD